MNVIEQLQQALSIPKEASRIMRVVAINNGTARLEAEGVTIYAPGTWAIGTRLVVTAGNVAAVVSESASTVYTD
jgi:hypothetical protein